MYQKVWIIRGFLESLFDDRIGKFRFGKVTASPGELVPAVEGHGGGR